MLGSPVPHHTVSDPEAERLLAEARERGRSPLAGRDRAVSALLAVGFAAVAALLAFQAAARPSPLVALCLVTAYALAARVEFQVGAGSAVPTQVFFVPMLFMAPPAWAPALVGGGYLLSHWLGRDRAEQPLSRSLVAVASSWYSVGPALVLGGLADGVRWSDWPLFVGALAAQLALDAAVSCLREWLVLDLSPRALAPYLARAYVVDVALSPIGVLAGFAGDANAYAFLLALPPVGLVAVAAGVQRRSVDQALELSSAYRGMVLLLGDLIDRDDAYTGAHSHAVVELVNAVCERMELSPAECRDAEFTALLHDVGKIAIPKRIIGKPGPLTLEERALMETHTVEGEQILARVGGRLARIGALVRSCHERWDGGGYPDGLAGEQIPLVARVVCCCDAYNAMTTDRPYRGARSRADALAELRRCSGSHFDPRVVDALVAVEEEPALRAA